MPVQKVSGNLIITIIEETIDEETGQSAIFVTATRTGADWNLTYDSSSRLALHFEVKYWPEQNERYKLYNTSADLGYPEVLPSSQSTIIFVIGLNFGITALAVSLTVIIWYVKNRRQKETQTN